MWSFKCSCLPCLSSYSNNYNFRYTLEDVDIFCFWQWCPYSLISFFFSFFTFFFRSFLLVLFRTRKIYAGLQCVIFLCDTSFSMENKKYWDRSIKSSIINAPSSSKFLIKSFKYLNPYLFCFLVMVGHLLNFIDWSNKWNTFLSFLTLET